jgi:hypothetical protein
MRIQFHSDFIGAEVLCTDSPITGQWNIFLCPDGCDVFYFEGRILEVDSQNQTEIEDSISDLLQFSS